MSEDPSPDVINRRQQQQYPSQPKQDESRQVPTGIDHNISRYLDPQYPDQSKLVSRNNHVQILADRLSIALALEFLGASLLAAARTWAGNNPYKFPAIGLAYFNLMIFAGHQSGGYFNPSLTLAALIRGKLNLIIFFLYSIAQFVGGFVGGALMWYFVLSPGFVVKEWGHVHLTMLPQPHISLWSILFFETFYMFWFAYFFLMLTSTWMSRNNVFYHIYLAAYFIVALGTTAIVAPGLLNPAITIGVILPAAMEHGLYNAKYTWLYLIGDYLGAILGSVVFMMVSLNDHKREFREAAHGNLAYKPY